MMRLFSKKYKKIGTILLTLFLVLDGLVFIYSNNTALVNNDLSVDDTPNFEKDLTLLELLPASLLEWNKTLDIELNDTGMAITNDSLGNIYIAGSIYNQTRGDPDVLLVKYNSSGILLWSKVWGGPTPEEAYDIALDNYSNIFVLGYSENQSNSDDRDICLVKFSNSGNYIWNRTWGNESWDIGYGLQIDLQNNLYITGYSEDTMTGEDIILFKVNSTGDLQWKTYWRGGDNDEGYDLALDPLGNIYITGVTSSFGPEGVNLIFMKYNRTGDLQWNKTWGNGLPDEGQKISIRSVNEILVVGNTRSEGSGGYDMIVIQWNNTGSIVWKSVIGGLDNDYGYSIIQDSQNNSIICGLTESNGDLNGNVWLVKINQTGFPLWNETWGGTLYDCAYDLVMDNGSNLFLAGQTKSGSDGTGDLLLLKISPKPGEFSLSSDAESPDADGSFSLSWTPSRDALNYSIYQSNQTIAEINENVTLLASGATNLSYNLYTLPEGNYSFLVIAFNRFGNISSNCINIIVYYPPGGFTLESDAATPDNDGTFTLNWSAARNADNYSIYTHSTFIKEIDNNGTLIIKGIASSVVNYTIENLPTGDYYYYVVVAQNSVGTNMSNCVYIQVGRTPLSFNLGSDADTPDQDGEFHLVWTPSNFSNNYTIFYSKNPATEGYSVYKQGLTPLKDWTEAIQYEYLIYDLGNGMYYFKITGYNLFGSNTSNIIIITIQIQSEENENSISNSDESQDNGGIYGFLMILGFIGLMSLLMFIAKKRKS